MKEPTRVENVRRTHPTHEVGTCDICSMMRWITKLEEAIEGLGVFRIIDAKDREIVEVET